MAEADIYESRYVCSLFDEMAATYGITNFLSSFGFCKRWRSQCINLASIEPGMAVYDLMSGMGECWQLINCRLNNSGNLVAVDLSGAMCRGAHERRGKLPRLQIEVLEQDFLNNTLPDASADCLISTFGLKTFSVQQMPKVAAQIDRILKPGGRFSLLEISVPPHPLIRIPFMLYLKYCIPLIGKALLGNPDNYRMLGIYTENFKDCSCLEGLLADRGLRVQHSAFFFGCATGLFGDKRQY